jgi:hypothetical protein
MLNRLVRYVQAHTLPEFAYDVPILLFTWALIRTEVSDQSVKRRCFTQASLLRYRLKRSPEILSCTAQDMGH